MARRFAVVLLVAPLISGCMLIQIASMPFPETIVDNQSASSYVAEIDGPQFIAVRPHHLTVVDSVGEVNAPTEHLHIWTSVCLSSTSVSGSFVDGGIVTIDDQGFISFVPKHTGHDGPTELDTGVASCQAAAQEL